MRQTTFEGHYSALTAEIEAHYAEHGQGAESEHVRELLAEETAANGNAADPGGVDGAAVRVAPGEPDSERKVAESAEVAQ